MYFRFLLVCLMLSSVPYCVSMEKAKTESKLISHSTDLIAAPKKKLMELCHRLNALELELNLEWRQSCCRPNALLFARSYAQEKKSLELSDDRSLTEQKDELFAYLDYLCDRVDALETRVDYPSHYRKYEVEKMQLRTRMADIKEMPNPKFQGKSLETFYQICKTSMASFEHSLHTLLINCFIEQVDGSVFNAAGVNHEVTQLLRTISKGFQNELEKYDEEERINWFEDLCHWLHSDTRDEKTEWDEQTKHAEFQVFHRHCAELRKERTDLLRHEQKARELLVELDPYNLQKLRTTELSKWNIHDTQVTGIHLVDHPISILLREYSYLEKSRLHAALLLADIVYWYNTHRDLILDLSRSAARNPEFSFEKALIAAYEEHRERCLNIQNQPHLKIALEVLKECGYQVEMMREMRDKNVSLLTTDAPDAATATFFALLLYNSVQPLYRDGQFALVNDFSDNKLAITPLIEAAHAFRLHTLFADLILFCINRDSVDALAQAMPWNAFPAIDPAFLGESEFVRLLTSKVAATGVPLEDLLENNEILSLADRENLRETVERFVPHMFRNIAQLRHRSGVLRGLEGPCAQVLNAKLKNIMAREVLLEAPVSHYTAEVGSIVCPGQNKFYRFIPIQTALPACQIEQYRIEGESPDLSITKSRSNFLDMHAPVRVGDQFYSIDMSTGELRAFRDIPLSLHDNKKLEIQRFTWKTKNPGGALKYGPSQSGRYELTGGAQPKACVVLSFNYYDFENKSDRTKIVVFDKNTGDQLHQFAGLPVQCNISVTNKYIACAAGDTVHLYDSQTFALLKDISIDKGTVGQLLCEENNIYITWSGPRGILLEHSSSTTDERTSVQLPVMSDISFLHNLGQSKLCVAADSAFCVVDLETHTILKTFHTTQKPLMIFRANGDEQAFSLLYDTLCLERFTLQRCIDLEAPEEIEKMLALLLQKFAAVKNSEPETKALAESTTT
jgi:hypothetical protein